MVVPESRSSCFHLTARLVRTESADLPRLAGLDQASLRDLRTVRPSVKALPRSYAATAPAERCRMADRDGVSHGLRVGPSRRVQFGIRTPPTTLEGAATMDKNKMKLPKEGLVEPEESRPFIDDGDVEGHGLPTTHRRRHSATTADPVAVTSPRRPTATTTARAARASSGSKQRGRRPVDQPIIGRPAHRRAFLIQAGSLAVAASRALTSNGLAAGYRDRSRAACPARCGAANELPVARLPPSRQATSTSSP